MFDEDTRLAYDENHRRYEVPESMTYREWKEGKYKNQPISQVKDKSKEIAEKLFPSEKWIPISASSSTSVFISETRQKDGKKDPAVYESDKIMALVLAEKSGKNVFMPPERNEGKNPDCIFVGEFLEMKHVRGCHRKVGKNAMNALTQAENVFLYVDKPTSIEECLSSVKGYYSNNKKQAIKENKEFKEPNKNGLLYIFTNGKLYKNVWGDVS